MHETQGFKPVELTPGEKLGILEEVLAASVVLEGRVTSLTNYVSECMAAEVVQPQPLVARIEDLQRRVDVMRKLVKMVEDE